MDMNKRQLKKKASKLAVLKTPNEMEYKHFKIKSFDEEKGIFEGYCAVKGNVDQYGEIIQDGAFDQAEGKTFPILFMHDPAKPVGLSTFVKEDDHGLYTRGQLDLDTELGRMVYSGIQKGYIDCMSIGYTVDKDNMNKKGNRLLEKVTLLEYSLITRNFAANSEARLTGYKQRGGRNMDRDFFNIDGEESSHRWNVPGLEEDMKRIHERHHHLKRRHEELRHDHEKLADSHEHMKRRHRKLEEMCKACMRKLSSYSRDHADDWEYYDGEYGYDVPNLFEVEPPGSHRGKSREDSFFF